MTVELPALDVSHLDDLRQWLQDPVARAALDAGPPPSSLRHAAWFERGTLDPTRDSRAIVTPGGDLVGACGLRDIDPVHRSAEVWVHVGPKHRRCGYATAAVAALVDEAWRTFGMHRLVARILVSNTGSQAVFEAAGFEVESVEIDAMWHDGDWTDLVVMTRFPGRTSQK